MTHISIQTETHFIFSDEKITRHAKTKANKSEKKPIKTVQEEIQKQSCTKIQRTGSSINLYLWPGTCLPLEVGIYSEPAKGLSKKKNSKKIYVMFQQISIVNSERIYKTGN